MFWATNRPSLRGEMWPKFVPKGCMDVCVCGGVWVCGCVWGCVCVCVCGGGGGGGGGGRGKGGGRSREINSGTLVYMGAATCVSVATIRISA